MAEGPSRRIYGILGYPVKHSLSPAMHNAAFQALKINAEYKLFEKKPEEVSGFLRTLTQENICGLNVTIPHKERVIPFLDDITPEARLIAAVNTIKVLGNKLQGHNTDGAGFLKHLSQDLVFNPQNSSIAIIGAGGAARAITVYLSQQRPESIAIYDAESPKALALVNHLKGNFQGIEFRAVDSIGELKIKDCDLLVNATPVGMKPTDHCLFKESDLRRGMLVYDLIYNPQETKLLSLAKKCGAKTSNGWKMLLYQGVLSFKIWTDRDAPLEIMRKALEQEIKNA